MAQVADSVRNSVRRFLDVVAKERRVAAAYIYGSEARHEASRWSDIDVAVVSPDFVGDLFSAQVELMKLAALVDDRIEPRAFTPEGFHVNDPLVASIKSTGVRVV